jgi:IMP cyclohydrolase
VPSYVGFTAEPGRILVAGSKAVAAGFKPARVHNGPLSNRAVRQRDGALFVAASVPESHADAGGK